MNNATFLSLSIILRVLYISIFCAYSIFIHVVITLQLTKIV